MGVKSQSQSTTNGVKRNSCDKQNDKNSKNPKRRRGNKFDFAKKFDDKTTDLGSNDPEWYATTPELLRDAASIPFSWSNGTPINLNMPTTYPDGLSIPGILTLVLEPTPGYSDAPTSPINIASTALYSFVRHANSGHSNYDSPDLMLYVLAMSEVNAYINFLMRIYSMSTLYAQRNRYLPDALLRANWVNPESIRNNLANFRYGINVLIHKAASLAVPSVMTFFRRKGFLYQNLYTEGDSIKDQLYMYVPSAFFQFSLQEDGSGSLVRKHFMGPFDDPATSMKTYDQLIQYGNDLLNPILGSEDMNIMSGDILKAFGDAGIIKYVELPENYPITPVFNIGVLEQMKNAGIMDGPRYDLTPVKQSENKAYLVYRNEIQNYPPELLESYRILTTATYATSPELVMESSRMMTSPKKVGDKYYVNSASESVVHAVVWVMDKFGVAKPTWLSRTTTSLDAISYLANFRFHPNIVLDDGAGKLRTFFDIDNFAVLTPDEVGRLHEAALLSMLNVPSIARLK